MASLTVIQGPDRGRRFEILDAASPIIGRDAHSTIRLHDNEASRQHAEIKKSTDGFVLLDLQSSNGTFLNGQKVEEQQLLKTGDRVRIGQTEMIFNSGSTGHALANDLANRISMTPANLPAESSAILRTINVKEGEQYLKHPEQAPSKWLQHALSNLAVMYETSQAISRISDVDQLIQHIMDLAFKSIKPDRGCIVLKDVDTGKLEPVAVRFAQGVDTEETITLSRTIVDWVLKSEEGVIVLDAAQDQRFRAAASVVRLGIHEAICVPMRGRHETLGVMYFDTKSDNRQLLETQQPTKFTDDHLRLTIAIAHQASLAIEDTRFHEAMMQAERLAAIGQTIATLSHHIKNILQGVRSGSYLIDMGLKDQKFDMLQQGWTIVQKNQGKIYDLVMDMLSISKEREPSWENCEVNQICRDVYELMAPRARDLGSKLEIKLAQGLPRIVVDPEGVHRALLNIVTNAIDAVEGVTNARVLLETGVDKKARMMLISVVDNGIGIPADRIGKIFQIFSSTKGSRGSGLGLAVSQKIIREHGGDIHVASGIGKGSRFTIDLPLRSKAPKEGDSNLQKTPAAPLPVVSASSVTPVPSSNSNKSSDGPDLNFLDDPAETKNAIPKFEE